MSDDRPLAEVAAQWDETRPETKVPGPRGAQGEFSDAQLAEQVAREVLLGAFWHTRGLGWLRWTSKMWTPCTEDAVIEKVRLYFLDWFHREVAGGCEPDRRSRLYRLLDRGTIVAVTALTRGMVQREAADFDRNPDLLNVQNGVVDLRTGKKHEHDPKYLMTHITAVALPKEGTTHPDWKAAQEALPEDVREHVLDRLGQGITGHPPDDDRVMLWQGGGENGKTTLSVGVMKALGDYAVYVSDKMLLSGNGEHPAELMDLRGARLALAEETPEARRLNSQRLKAVVGTPIIKARHMRKDWVSFDATHTLIISTNHRPVVEETDWGTWRRVELVRFPYLFRRAAEESVECGDCRTGDPGLRDRMKTGHAQQEAVLRTLVDHAVAWYRRRRMMPEPPKQVMKDTLAWRESADLALAYMRERIVFQTDVHVWPNDVLADVNTWLRTRGHQGWSKRLLDERIGEHEELAKHRVQTGVKVKGGTPAAGNLSRPLTVVYGMPGSYRAWNGMRFRKPDEDVEEGEEE